MRLRRCSKTDFRKNLRRYCFLSLFFLAALLPAEVAHEGTVVLEAQALRVSVSVTGADPLAFFRNLNDGLSARVEFSIRVSEGRQSPFRILGPRFLSEAQVVHSAYHDPFREAYVLTHADGRESLYEDEDALWQAFFELRDYTLPRDEIGGPVDPSRLVVELRASYRPIVFVPALGILSIFLSEDRFSSLWAREPVLVEAP